MTTTLPTCHECKRELATDEDAWMDEWKVYSPEGWTLERRYICDGCAEPMGHPHGSYCPDPCDHDAECPHGRSWMRHEHCAECEGDR